MTRHVKGQPRLSPQARLLRKTVVGRLVKQLFACLVAFIACALLLEQFAAGPISNYLVDTADTWTFPDETVEEEAAAQNELQELYYLRPNAVWDIQTNPADHTLHVRDLTLYHLVKIGWLPALGCAALVFVVGFVLAAFRRMYGLVDDLAGGVASLLHDEREPISLPPELEVTERELERLRRESLAREETAKHDRARTQELMAYLAHDVRTPLTAVIGNLSLLEESPGLGAEDRHRADVALSRANEIEELTGDLFDVTRISLDPGAVSLEPVDLQLLALQVVDGLAAEGALDPASGAVSATERKAPVPGRPVSVRADADLLAKALRHLIQTAVALSEPCSPVAISGGSGEGRAFVLVEAPIAPLDSASARTLETQAFEPFYLKGSARGVSLEFAREIARALGGDVTLRLEQRHAILTLALPSA